MRNVWVVAKREYLERVRAKSFIITTLLMPVLMTGMMLIPSKLAGMKSSKVRNIAVVTDAPEFAGYLRQEIANRNKERDTGTNLSLEVVKDSSDASIARLRHRMEGKDRDLDAYLVATRAVLQSGKIKYTARETSDFVEAATLNSAINLAAARQRLADRGLNDTDVNAVFARLDFETVRLEGGKESKTSSLATMLMSMTMVMMIYMSVLLYGIAVLRAVLEEKTSRVVEVMLASVTPKEMMAGKIIGVGAVGLTQIVIWWLLAALGGGFLIASAGLVGTVSVAGLKLGWLLVFFLLGYGLYSALWAALGAMVNAEQEAQQMNFVVMLPIIFCMMVMVPVIRQPDGPLAFWVSMVPFCTPIIMYLRILVQPPPLWQVLTAVGVMMLTTYGLLVACSRIYRVGILMYGKKPNLPEILKWMRYA